MGKLSPWIWSLAAMASCGFSRAQTHHFSCSQCWMCSARARSTIQPAAATFLIRPVIQLVLLHPSEAPLLLTRVGRLSAFRLGVFTHFYLMRLADLVKTGLF